MAQRLPIDVIFTIIEAGTPVNPRTILPASHQITKTLLAWTQVCHATSAFAARLLRKHCMYIDSEKKLQSLLDTMRREAVSKPDPLHICHHRVRARPGAPSQMFLGPFPCAKTRYSPRPLDDPVVATGVRDLFFAVAPTLCRLIVDMPLRSLYPDEDFRNVRKPLRDGFTALVNLEELVSVRDELYLNVDERGREEAEIWATCWPKLRRLSLYNVDLNLDTGFLEHLAGVPLLESVVFTRPDGLYEWYDPTTWRMPYSAIDIKAAWLDALSANAYNGGLKRRKDLSIMFVSMPEQIPIFDEHEESWEKIDPEGLICVKFAGALAPSSPLFEQTRGVQDFVRGLALDGTLFDANMGERMDLHTIY